jgi:hypothetical protein
MVLYNASNRPDARLNALIKCNKAAGRLRPAWLQAAFVAVYVQEKWPGPMVWRNNVQG